MNCYLEVDEREDSLSRYYICMSKALSTLRGCLGMPAPREDELKPPPGWDRYPTPPGRGNPHGKDYPNW